MNKAQILFVGDFDKDFLKQIQSQNWEMKQSPTAEKAINLLEKEKFSLIIAKDKIELLNGYQLCLLVKSSPFTYNLPFYILGEKKRRNLNVNGLLAQPDRIAEYVEVINKPQSLVKLIKEDLKDFGKNSKVSSQRTQFLPACDALQLDDTFSNKINGELLLERFVSVHMLSLLHWPKAKNEYLAACFSVLNDILKADLFGITISSLHKPWLAFSGSKNLNQQSFDNLMCQLKDNLVSKQEMTILSKPPLTGKDGCTISDLIVLPFVNDGSASGKLIFAKYDNRQFSALERVIIGYIEYYAKPLFEFLIAEQVMDKVLNQEAVKAAVDSLTGLYNLEFLIGFLQQQLLFSFRNKLAVSLLIVDVDGFTQINGALGQAIADTILVKLAEKLLSVIRGSDLLARYSGDRFVIVLPNTALKGARVVAEKIRLEVEQTNFFLDRQPGPNITVSVGVAEYDPHDLNPETILKEAKSALQKAKESGRNKVAL